MSSARRPPAPVHGLAMHAVALVVLHRCDGRVDGDFVKIRTAQPTDLRVNVGVDASRQKGIIGEVDSRNDMGGTKRHLFRFGKEIVRIAVAHQVPVFLVGIELDGEAAHIACRVLGPAFTGDRGITDEYRRDLAGFGEGRCNRGLAQ